MNETIYLMKEDHHMTDRVGRFNLHRYMNGADIGDAFIRHAAVVTAVCIG